MKSSRSNSPASNASQGSHNDGDDGSGEKEQESKSNSPAPSSQALDETNPTETKEDETEEDIEEYPARTPLCICPTCKKILASMKSLFGHYGRSHKMSVNQNKIKFACPFCKEDDAAKDEIYDTTNQLEGHIGEHHPECTLLTTLTELPAGSGTTPKLKRSKSSTSQTPRSSTSHQTTPTTTTQTAAERRRSTRHSVDDNNDDDDGKPSSKPIKQQYKHPLCKCPSCPKIFLPQGLFGHFGRVHSGQLGHTAQFDWKNVCYACPFCPTDVAADGGEGGPSVYKSIELAEAHVASAHENCHLTRPNAISGGSSGSSGSATKRSPPKQPEGVGSGGSMTRKSRRGSGSRRSSPFNVQEDGGDDEGSTASSSPTAGTRKSQRSRRSVDICTIIPTPTSATASKQKSAVDDDEEEDDEEEYKPLYNCPDCDKTNLTKHGLHAHYGMVHGGKVDLSKIKPILPKKPKKKKRVMVSMTGPWSDEEHNAFLEGHNLYGNRWKQISVEFVPTRDAKQIGSHALNYFTTKGIWSKVGGRPGGRPGERPGEMVEDLVVKQPQRKSKRENSGKTPRSLLGSVVMSSADSVMDIDDESGDEGGLQEGQDAMSVGSIAAAAGGSKESDAETNKKDGAPDSPDDGNSSHCIVCFEGGNIVCCSKCPRAYHPKCLSKDGHGYLNVDLLPNDWQCNRCKKDTQVKVGEKEEISQYAFGNKKIRMAYSEFKECGDYGYCCTILSNILDILKKLMNYDYGYVFSEPVDPEDVPDYHDVVQTPMDYGTVSYRLENGNYVDLISSDDASHASENSTMEEILLHVLCDIDRVHHNCHLYNRAGSSIYRIGDVHSTKWNAYFSQYILEKLPENVSRDLTLFRHNCELELREECHSKRRQKEVAKEKAKQSRTKKKSTTPKSSPTSVNRKRKASEELDEDDHEDEHVEEDDEEELEEEDQPKRKPKKAKQDIESPGHSSALLFTEHQLRSLENVFFSSVAKLREETADEPNASSADLMSLVGCSPSAASSIANNDDGNRDDDNRSASAGPATGVVDGEAVLTSEIPSDSAGPTGVNPNDSAGPTDVNSGAAALLTSAKSEESLQDLRHNYSEVSSASGVGARTSISPTTVPQLITSGPTIVGPPSMLPKTSSCSSPTSGGGALDNVVIDVDKMVSTPDTTPNNPNGTSPSGANSNMGEATNKGTTFQRQWYERLTELKKFKILHGTAVVSATSNDKLYHWRLRQRKRYHLTLFRMPHLKKDSSLPSWDESSGGRGGEDKGDKTWLSTLPEMKGVFSLTAFPGEEGGVENAPKPFTITDRDVEFDEKSVEVMRLRHQEQLYCPPLPYELLVAPHSSRHSNSLFWDECLEEMRFYEGEHNHTVVPRDFPQNSFLALWVENQRAKYLLQCIGIFAGLTGSQMFVLDELNLCDLSSLPTVDAILASVDGRTPAKSVLKSPTPQKGSGHSKKRNKPKEESSPERKSWTTHAIEFKEWFQKLPLNEKPKARELLPQVNWPLYSWCWRQCNASSAVLCGTPTIRGINMSIKKLNTLASSGLFRAFPYNDRSGLVVCEDDYEGCDAFDSTFQVLEDFSIKYGSTHVPDWYECDAAFRMWISALENGLYHFVRGEPCVLSGHQIEKLILIGFFNDREGLPNLSKGDVVWLKMFVELKKHLELFGVCNVSSDFPGLFNWVAEQKELFRLSRMGRKDIMNSSRLKMLMEAGVDFFTGECLPGTSSLSESRSRMDFKEFELITSSAIECFPAQGSATSNGWDFQYDNYWNNHDCRAKFEQFKAKNGHSLLLAHDDEDIYWWFVEKRGNALLSEINSLEFDQGFESDGLYSHSILRYVTAPRHADDGGDSKDEKLEVDQSMFLWLHYCERLMVFKAREGHCKIPNEYPDTPLRLWLGRQQELIHLYSTNQPIELRPVQLKILHALGVHGNKRHAAPPKLSSRMLKRNYPSKRKKHVASKSKNE